ncbi:MAG: TatD family hydrolase [candidate division WOR-3 bacterium]
MIFDTHTHLNDEVFEKDLDSVIERAFEKGVEKMIVVGYDVPSSEKAIEISRKYKGKIFASCSIHPHEADDFEKDFPKIEELSKEEGVVAIGETGLDFYKDFSKKEAQIDCFKAHIELSKKRNLPLILHVRNAFPEVFEILKDNKNLKGIFHCFSGGINEAKKAFQINFFISFSGSLTYGSKKLESSLKILPLDRILFETDCPYLTPRPLKGRNEPSYIHYTIEFAANLLKIDYKELSKISFENSLKIFNLE